MLVVELFFLYFDIVEFDGVAGVLDQDLRALFDGLLALLVVTHSFLFTEGVQSLDFEVFLVLNITEIVGKLVSNVARFGLLQWLDFA